MAAPKTYEMYQQEVAPFWARQALGSNFWATVGRKEDQAVAIAKQAVQARFIRNCPLDALEAIGAERRLPRYDLPDTTPQTDDEYRQTLLDAWELWYWGGTAKGMLDELYRAFQPYTSFKIVTQQGRIWSRATDGTISFVDTGIPRAMGPNDLWNTFQVWFVIDSGGALPWATIPDNDSQEAATTRAIIEAWRAGHSKCHSIVVVESGYPWGYIGDDDGGVAIEWTVPPPTDWGEAVVSEIWTP